MKSFYFILLLCFIFISSTFSQEITGITFPTNANGTYTPNGDLNGKQSWINSNSYYVYWDSGYWVIDVNTSIGDNAEFYIINSDDTPPSSGYTNGTGSGTPALSGFVLPVELTSFEAKLVGSSVELEWETATEVNNAGFDVQRKDKSNGLTSEWTKIAFVDGAGESNSPKSYSHTDDEFPAASVLYYRLKQIDNDGTFEYSKVDSVVFSITGVDDHTISYDFQLSQNYPNPFNPTTKISYTVPSSSNAQNVTLKVYDILGNEVASLVNEAKQSGNYEVTFNAGKLTSGVYFYRINIDGNIAAKKMILLK